MSEQDGLLVDPWGGWHIALPKSIRDGITNGFHSIYPNLDAICANVGDKPLACRHTKCIEHIIKKASIPFEN